MRRHATLLLLVTLCLPLSASSQAGEPIQLRVDMTDASRHLVHVRETLPAHPGDNVYEYPQWIPGEHGPNGPIDAVAGVHFSANGKEVTWRRDLVDLYALHANVPAATSHLELIFAFISSGGLFSNVNAMAYGGVSSHLAMLEMCRIQPTHRPFFAAAIPPGTTGVADRNTTERVPWFGWKPTPG